MIHLDECSLCLKKKNQLDFLSSEKASGIGGETSRNTVEFFKFVFSGPIFK